MITKLKNKSRKCKLKNCITILNNRNPYPCCRAHILDWLIKTSEYQPKKKGILNE